MNTTRIKYLDMDEAIARAGNPKYSSSSAFRLVQALAEKENA